MDKVSPFLIQGPAFISFSGGRTSAYMLWRALAAHGGQLPDNVHVVFANTGKERHETLAFVANVARHWDVPVNWVEWRATPDEVENRHEGFRAWLDERPERWRMVDPQGFELVGHNAASRHGEPFQALIIMKRRLPNWRQRWCTENLKVETMTRFARSLGLAPGGYSEVVGLRRDEPWRYAKMVGRNVDDGRKCLAPLYHAGVTKADVMSFWRQQPFDLGLQPWEGNCDLCFLKGRGIRKRILRDKPEIAEWWSGNETAEMRPGLLGWFDKRDRVAGLLEEVRRAPELWDLVDPEDDHETECGLYCGPPDDEEAA